MRTEDVSCFLDQKPWDPIAVTPCHGDEYST